MRMNNEGSLTVVGTGIKIAADMTLLAKAQIAQADVVFMVVPDLASKEWIASLNSNTIDLTHLYGGNKSRLVTYNDMAQQLVDGVKSGKRVCAAFYGHPGVFAYASHLAIEQVKSLGYAASMEPGVSAEDCLVADLGLDPGKSGCVSIEATQYLFYQRVTDPCSLMLLWQIGMVGDHTCAIEKTDSYQLGLAVLTDELLKHYPPEHEVIIYEAATLAIFPPRAERLRLSQLPQAKLTAISTLVIPPYREAQLDHEVLAKLGLNESDIINSLDIEK